MKKILLYVIIFVFATVVEANYCVQVMTTNIHDRDIIVQRASQREFSSFDDVRVERRGGYFVFRIGDYSNYKDATRAARYIKDISSDAYVRKCDFVREQAIYIKNDSQDRRNQRDLRQPPRKGIYDDVYYNDGTQAKGTQSYIQEQPQETKPKQYIKKEYKQKEELSYRKVDTSDSLWRDCKKCFVPVYEEDDTKRATPPPPRHSYNQPEKQVKPVAKPKRQNDFWAEDIKDKDMVPKHETKKPREKPRNKFNIDERFLP